MFENYRQSIHNSIEAVWSASGVWLELLEGMRRAIPAPKRSENRDYRPRVWAPLLPGLCCQAAGGELHWAVPVSAAWNLFHVAAHILDNIADQDKPESWWESMGTGPALNVATGLIFSAFGILTGLYKDPTLGVHAPTINEEFNNYLLMIASGQQADLAIKEPSTSQWWHIAEAKSGAPFSLACRVGASLATDDIDLVERFGLYGYHLGLIIQMLDDARDFLPTWKSNRGDEARVAPWSLPIAYAMEVYPDEQKRSLQRALSEQGENPASGEKVLEIVEQSGASIYLETNIDLHRRKALACLDAVTTHSWAREQLVEILDQILQPE